MSAPSLASASTGRDDIQSVHPSRRALLTTSSDSSQQNQSQQNNAPPSQAGSLFGGAAAQTSQPQQTSHLFGNTQTSQPQQSTSLFGNTGGLFSSLGQQSQPQNTSTIFNTSGTTLFPPQPDSNQNMTGKMFYHSTDPANDQQTRPAGSSVFGMSAISPDQLNASLLGASQFRASQAPPAFVGKLSMGQGAAGNTAAQQAASIVGAVKVHQNDLRSTTRFQDCVDEVKEQFEMVDTMIQKQERFCRQIQALLAKHESDINCLPPRVGVVKEKAEGVEMVLSLDAQAVERVRKEVEGDRRDFVRGQRVAENLLLPAVGYQVPNNALAMAGYSGSARSTTVSGRGDEDYDTDLIGNYFLPLSASLQQTLGVYASNLADIEAHMNVIEASAVAQAQHLAAKKAGVGGGQSGMGGGTVRDLAETLTGFEGSLLGVARVVGECREGVNGLVLGRLREAVGTGVGARGRGW